MRIGIDIGGTKIEIICLNKSNGKELYRQRIPTPGDYDTALKAIKKLVHQAEKTIGKPGTVGIGIPGTISDTTHVVKNANTTWLNGTQLDKDLEKLLKRPVKLNNDANCFTVSEATDGAAKGQKVVFGVIIGTGCGGGLVINGQPISGLNGLGGEWGHNPLPYPLIYQPKEDISHNPFFITSPRTHDNPSTDTHGLYVNYHAHQLSDSEWPGPLCYCGRHGCLETWISGPGLKNDYLRQTGKHLSTHDIIAKAQKGEEKAFLALTKYMDRLARGLAGVINVVDPDVIVLGGGMSNVAALYTEVPQMWGKYIFSDTVRTLLLPPRYGDSSGVRGAAWLWNESTIDQV